jgi:phage-related protein
VAGTLASLLVSLDLDAEKFTAGAKKAAHDVDQMADRISSVGDRGAMSILRLANNLAAIPTAAHGIGAVVGVLGSMSGAIGLIPAAGAGAIITISALKLGMQGFADTIKETDPKAFAESLKELSPAAQQSAIAVRNLKDDWERMQNSVQNQLFEGLADDINRLGKSYLPVLGKGLGNINAQFNAAAQRTALWLTKTEQVKTVSGIFGNTTLAVSELTRGIQPLIQIILDLVAVGSEFLPGLSGGFGEAAQNAAEFVRHARETGQLHAWISEGLSALGDLWQLLSNVGSIVATIWRAFDVEGAGALNMLINLTGQLEAFLKSAEGQEMLHRLAEILGVISDVVGQVLITALRQLAPVVAALAPGFAELVRQIGGLLVDALVKAGPMLTDFATWLSDNMDWLGPVALGVYAFAKAIGVASAAVQFLTVVSKVNPWILLATTLIAVVTAIIYYWDEIKAAVSAAIDWIIGFVKEYWPYLIGLVTGPIGVIVGLVIKYWDEIVAVIRNAWDAIVGWVRDKVNAVMRIMDRLGDLGRRAWEWFGGLVMAALWKTQELLDWIGALPGKIWNYLGYLGNLLYNSGRDLIYGLVRGIDSVANWIYNRIIGIAQSAWNAILDFFGIASPSKEMQWVGEMLGEGLARGIAGMVGTVGAAADRLSSAAMVDLAAPAMATPAIPSPRVPAIAAVGAGARGGDGSQQSADMAAAVRDGVFAALDGVRLRVDGDGLARVVNRANLGNARR